jgi:hypothetical protein
MKQAIRLFSTGHPISDTVVGAFAEGLAKANHGKTDAVPHFSGAIERPADDDGGGVGVFYGILRGNGEAIKARWRARRPFIYIDHGYMGRYTDLSKLDGTFRVCRNGLHARLIDSPIRPHSRCIIVRVPRAVVGSRSRTYIAPPSEHVCRFFGVDLGDWLDSAVTAHPAAAVLRKSDPGASAAALTDAVRIVSWQSNLMSDAVFAGVPQLEIRNPPAGGMVTEVHHPVLSLFRYTVPDWTNQLGEHQMHLANMRAGGATTLPWWNILFGDANV